MVSPRRQVNSLLASVRPGVRHTRVHTPLRETLNKLGCDCGESVCHILF